MYTVHPRKDYFEKHIFKSVQIVIDCYMHLFATNVFHEENKLLYYIAFTKWPFEMSTIRHNGLMKTMLDEELSEKRGDDCEILCSLLDAHA